MARACGPRSSLAAGSGDPESGGVCGRYSFALGAGELRELTGSAPDPLPRPVYNQPPGGPVLALVGPDQWSYPPWGMTLAVGGKRRFVLNARSETAPEKRLFRGALAGARCVVPASGFFEWQRSGGRSQPYYFLPREAPGLLLGGLCVETDGEGPRVVLLTREADEWMAVVHHRVPALVDPRRLATWLDPSADPGAVVGQCCFPRSEEVLRARPVSRRVNRVAENDADLLREVPVSPAPAEEAAEAQLSLFGSDGEDSP